MQHKADSLQFHFKLAILDNLILLITFVSKLLLSSSSQGRRGLHVPRRIHPTLTTESMEESTLLVRKVELGVDAG